jgi:hypothetical protein
MSLVRILARVAAVEAVKGRSLVGANVLDSQIGALEAAADGKVRTDQEKPFIAVYTDAANAEGHLSVRALNQNGLTEILFETGITAAMVETNDAGESVVVGIPATDRALEFFLDIVARQITDALTDPDNRWAEIFRGLVYRVVKVERARTGNIMNGVRLAGQQVKIVAELIEDPVRGDAPEAGTPFAEALSAMEMHVEPVLAAQAALIRAQVQAEGEHWDHVQRRLGLTRSELLSLGLGPLAADQERAAPVAEEATLEMDGIEPPVVVKR